MSLSGRWKYTRLRPKNTATYTRYRNWLSSRYWRRVNAGGPDKRPLPDRVSRAVTSRTPVVRNRVNPATGRPRRDDARPRRDRAARQRLYGDPRGTWQARTARERTGRSR